MTARLERGLLLLICAAFAVACAFAVVVGGSFEFDEAVYAVQARAWVEGTPASGVRLHRAPLLPAIGTLIVRATESEAAFRVIGIAFGLGLIVAVWAIARRLGGPAAGVLAAAIAASNHNLIRRSGQFLTDVPAAVCLALLVLVLLREDARRLWMAAPLAAAAFYFRYGSAVPVAAVLATYVVVRWRVVRARPWAHLATAAALALLLLPHMVHATRALGAPWRIVTHTAKFAAQASPGEGLVEYLTWLPGFLAGPMGFAAIVAAVVGVVGAFRRQGEHVVVVVPALIVLVALGIAAHAEARFMFFPVAMFTAAGAAVLMRALPRRITALAAAAAVALVAGSATAIVITQRNARERAVVARAAEEIDRRAPDGCAAVSVLVPVASWYSRCAVGSPHVSPVSQAAIPPGDPRFLVLTSGTAYALDPVRLEAWLALTEGDHLFTAVGLGRRLGYATVYRLDRGSSVGGPETWTTQRDDRTRVTFDSPSSWTLRTFEDVCVRDNEGTLIMNHDVRLHRPQDLPQSGETTRCTHDWDLRQVPADFVAVEISWWNVPAGLTPAATDTAFPLSLADAERIYRDGDGAARRPLLR